MTTMNRRSFLTRMLPLVAALPWIGPALARTIGPAPDQVAVQVPRKLDASLSVGPTAGESIEPGDLVGVNPAGEFIKVDGAAEETTVFGVALEEPDTGAVVVSVDVDHFGAEVDRT